MVQQPRMRTSKDWVLNLVLTYLCFSIYLFHNKGKRGGTITLLSSYTGLGAQSRSLTDVESRLRLNPSCLKPSSLDYPSQPLVTSAKHKNGFSVCFVCIYASVCTSCGSLDKKNNNNKNPAPSACWSESFTDRKRTHKSLSSNRDDKSNNTYFSWQISSRASLTLTYQSIKNQTSISRVVMYRDKHHHLWVTWILIHWWRQPGGVVHGSKHIKVHT